MATTQAIAAPQGSPSRPAAPPRHLDFFAGLLSYLVPGLGQIVQGRIAKGVLFLVCVYGLFFYGLVMGRGSVTIGARTYRLTGNVYLPDTYIPPADDRQGGSGLFQSQLAWNLYNRPQFAGQFWVGVAAWPAIWQYRSFDRAAAEQQQKKIDDLYSELESALKNGQEDTAKEKREAIAQAERDPSLRHPVLGEFMREPSISALNAVHNAGDKRLELAWVFTVIAGVLNIMVIYDAIAGPAFTDPAKDPTRQPS